MQNNCGDRRAFFKNILNCSSKCHNCTPISTQTVQNSLLQERLVVHRSYVGPPLIPRRRIDRHYLSQHGHTIVPMRQRRHVLITDESRFSLHRSQGRRRFYHRNGQRCVVERDRFGRDAVMQRSHGTDYGLEDISECKHQSLSPMGANRLALQRQCLPAICYVILRRQSLTVQQENAKPHVVSVYRDFMAVKVMSRLWNSHHTDQIYPIQNICVMNWTDMFENVAMPQITSHN